MLLFEFETAVPLPPRLTGPQQWEIRKAAEYGNQPLRSQILAAILATRIFSDHPLHNLAKKYPEAFAAFKMMDTFTPMYDNIAGDKFISLLEAAKVFE